MIIITPSLSIDEDELHEDFVRSSGPGGQNVNKVSTAVQLRFDVARSLSLPDDVRARLIKLSGNRITAEGVLIIEAQQFRSQVRNRQDAQDRLVELIRKATQKPKPRKKTKPTFASKLRRLDSKKKRGQSKRLRGSSIDSE